MLVTHGVWNLNVPRGSDPRHGNPTSAGQHSVLNLEGALLLGQTKVDPYRKVVVSKSGRATSLKRLEALVQFADQAEFVLERAPRTCREWCAGVQELLGIAKVCKPPGATPRLADKPRDCWCGIVPCLSVQTSC